MVKQTVTLFADEFLVEYDLNLIIRNDRRVFHDRIAVLINGTDFDLKISIDDIPFLISDLEVAAQKLVTEIKSDIPKSRIPDLLVDNQVGLAAHGYTALNRIFSQQTIDFIDLHLQNLGKHIKFPVVGIQSDFFSIPWEWLYKEPPQKVKTDNLSSTMKPFWGMSFIIARMDAPGSTRAYGYFSNKTPIKVGVITDEDLEFTKEEVAWLEQQEKDDNSKIKLSQFKISGTSNGWNFVEAINKFLNRDFNIIHLACHAEAENAQKLNSYFSVSNGWKYRIRNLTAYPQVNMKASLVFFNACSTGIRNPLETLDFVKEFQKAGASNVIAVEASVETEAAFNFAQTFYSHFLGGAELGEALIMSRHQIIKNSRRAVDVVVLFYSLYGNPRTRIPQQNTKEKK